MLAIWKDICLHRKNKCFQTACIVADVMWSEASICYVGAVGSYRLWEVYKEGSGPAWARPLWICWARYVKWKHSGLSSRASIVQVSGTNWPDVEFLSKDDKYGARLFDESKMRIYGLWFGWILFLRWVHTFFLLSTSQTGSAYIHLRCFFVCFYLWTLNFEQKFGENCNLFIQSAQSGDLNKFLWDVISLIILIFFCKFCVKCSWPNYDCVEVK